MDHITYSVKSMTCWQYCLYKALSSLQQPLHLMGQSLLKTEHILMPDL